MSMPAMLPTLRNSSVTARRCGADVGGAGASRFRHASVTALSCAVVILLSRSPSGGLNPDFPRTVVQRFLQLLQTQRWDDHRFYHQSRINQSLHLISAISFLVAYGVLFTDPALAAIIGWCISMATRQSGHFFFEPRGFDQVNQVSDEHKEEIKVGYNMLRKTVLITIWALIPALLWLTPSLFGLIEPATTLNGLVHDVGMAWLALGVTGMLLRVLQLWVRDDLLTGLAWMCKILTDPFHDIMLYHKAPLHLLRGELLDPMPHVRHQ
jgi:hypothetical protein